MPKKALIRIIAEAVAVTVMVAMAVAGCTQGRPEKYTGPVEKITVAAAAYLTGALVYVAEDQGYFEENGLEVTIKDYESGKAAADALIDGEALPALPAG